MPIDFNDLDEVWLALEQAGIAFKRNGHKPNTWDQGCADCHAYGLIERGKEAYVERMRNSVTMDEIRKAFNDEG